jgi:Protein of unknown function (DUF1203)
VETIQKQESDFSQTTPGSNSYQHLRRTIMSFRVIALTTETADQVRATGKSPRYGHPAHTELATGYGPCRHCLRTFQKGEENRILFTYDPFNGIERVPLPGPIFIHEEPCSRYREECGYPPDMKPYPIVLNAYANGQALMERQLVGAEEDKTRAVESLLQRPDVDYVEVRDQTAGCFDFRIERF